MAISLIKLYFENGLINLEEKGGRRRSFELFIICLTSLHHHEMQVGV